MQVAALPLRGKTGSADGLARTPVSDENQALDARTRALLLREAMRKSVRAERGAAAALARRPRTSSAWADIGLGARRPW
jgi:hypothetical protein